MTTKRPGYSARFSWLLAALLGFAVGLVLIFAGESWEQMPGIVVLLLLFVSVAVPSIVVLVGVVGTLFNWRNGPYRVRSVAVVVFGVAWIATYFGVAQLQLRGLL